MPMWLFHSCARGVEPISVQSEIAARYPVADGMRWCFPQCPVYMPKARAKVVPHCAWWVSAGGFVHAHQIQSVPKHSQKQLRGIPGLVEVSSLVQTWRPQVKTCGAAAGSRRHGFESLRRSWYLHRLWQWYAIDGATPQIAFWCIHLHIVDSYEYVYIYLCICLYNFI